MSAEKTCYTCGNCLYVLEGNYVCEKEMVSDVKSIQPIMEKHAPADHSFWCGDRYWVAE